MAKPKDTPRGATPRVVKERKQWNLKLPDFPWQWLLLPVIAGVLVVGARWAYQSWPIRDVEVSGRLSVLKADDIAARILWVKNNSFFSLDTQKVYDDVAAMPLVQGVKVRKRWPGLVQVVVTEDVPMAVWNGVKLLTISGHISDIPAGFDVSALAKIEGHEGQADNAMRYFRRIQQSFGGKALQINKLSVDEVGSVLVTLSNGWDVHFGRQYFEERVQRLTLLLSSLPEEKVSGLDLRYGKGAAVRWRSEQEMG